MTTLTKQGDACVLAVAGELNRASVEQFREFLDTVTPQDFQ